MKYEIICKDCGETYNMWIDFRPTCCVKCGSQEIESVSYNQKRWADYSARTYIPQDHSNDLAVKMFGKRLRDLTSEEKREYNKLRTRESRARRKKVEQEQ